ncbi:MAG: hypothetical protein RIG62_18305 [Cyclobacteriaceae bacterium]
MNNHHSIPPKQKFWNRASLRLQRGIRRFCQRLEVYATANRYSAIFIITLVAVVVVPVLIFLSLSVRPSVSTIQIPTLARQVLEKRFHEETLSEVLSPLAADSSKTGLQLTVEKQLAIGLKLHKIQQSVDPEGALRAWLQQHPTVLDSIQAFTSKTP